METIGPAELLINLRFLHYLATILQQSCVVPVRTVWSESPKPLSEIAVLRRISLELRACPPLRPMCGCCGAQMEKCVIPSKKDGEISLSLAFLGKKADSMIAHEGPVLPVLFGLQDSPAYGASGICPWGRGPAPAFSFC